jgi:hypothetical protein
LDQVTSFGDHGQVGSYIGSQAQGLVSADPRVQLSPYQVERYTDFSVITREC